MKLACPRCSGTGNDPLKLGRCVTCAHLDGEDDLTGANRCGQIGDLINRNNGNYHPWRADTCLLCGGKGRALHTQTAVTYSLVGEKEQRQMAKRAHVRRILQWQREVMKKYG